MACDNYRPDHNGECLTCDENFDDHWQTVARVVKRIGDLRLYRSTAGNRRWAVSLDNRTYHNFFEIPPARVDAWLWEFGKLTGRLDAFVQQIADTGKDDPS